MIEELVKKIEDSYYWDVRFKTLDCNYLGDEEKLDMLVFESYNGYKKVCILKDEVPFKYIGQNALHLSTKSGDTKWHPRHISSYAMVHMKYMDNQKNKTDIIINYGEKNTSYKSQVLPFNKTICAGLNNEFADATDEFFKEYHLGKLPGGTIEILSGGFDDVGSSNIAFKKTMELLTFVFRHIDELSDNELQRELLKRM